MANRKQHLTELTENVKAKKFINKQYKETGEMPSVEAVAEAKELTPAELAQVDVMVQAAELADMAEASSYTPDWDYIVDEASWNASYASGALKDYYVWADQVNAPYKEDLWNTVENRPARLSDAKKDPETGEYILDENGNYIYENCERCWKGAFYAPGAQYPWAAVKFQPLFATIKFSYEGKDDVFPWGKAMRAFKRTFAIASIPGEFEMAEWKSDFDGNTSDFEKSKFGITLYKEQ